VEGSLNSPAGMIRKERKMKLGELPIGSKEVDGGCTWTVVARNKPETVGLCNESGEYLVADAFAPAHFAGCDERTAIGGHCTCEAPADRDPMQWLWYSPATGRFTMKHEVFA
jgi:hypothetical protein